MTLCELAARIARSSSVMGVAMMVRIVVDWWILRVMTSRRWCRVDETMLPLVKHERKRLMTWGGRGAQLTRLCLLSGKQEGPEGEPPI